jgi:hypothetical protein
MRDRGVAQAHWPLVVALAAQQFIMVKDAIGPRVALSL